MEATVLEGELLPRLVQIGERLANGATVLATKPYQGMTDSVIILALVHQEFVTWVGRADGTETFWGHYFNDLGRALADFSRRS